MKKALWGDLLTKSNTFSVRIIAPAARTANATAKTSDWQGQEQEEKWKLRCILTATTKKCRKMAFQNAVKKLDNSSQ